VERLRHYAYFCGTDLWVNKNRDDVDLDPVFGVPSNVHSQIGGRNPVQLWVVSRAAATLSTVASS